MQKSRTSNPSLAAISLTGSGYSVTLSIFMCISNFGINCKNSSVKKDPISALPVRILSSISGSGNESFLSPFVSQIDRDR